MAIPVSHPNLYTDLSFLICSPQFSSVLGSEEKFNCFEKAEFLITKNSPSLSFEDFYAQFPSRLKKILNLIKDLDADSVISADFECRLLVHKVCICVQHFFQYRDQLHGKELDPCLIPGLYLLAKTLKQNSPYHRKIWQQFPQEIQTFFHSISPWTAHVTASLERNYRWLMYDYLILTPNQEIVADFGDGYIHRLVYLTETAKHAVFALKNHSQYLWHPLSIDRQREWADVMQSDQLDKQKMGRIDEIFDISFVEENLEGTGATSPIRYATHNQILELLSCYQAALLDALGLRVQLPISISPRGEWVIWPTQEKQAFDKDKLTPIQLEDMLNYFQAEQLGNLNILGNHVEHSTFYVLNGRLFLAPVSLPIYDQKETLTQKQAHFLSSLKLNESLQSQYDEYEIELKIKKERQKQLLKCLKTLFDKKILTLQEAWDLTPRFILMMRLMNVIELKNPLKNSTYQARYVLAKTMIADIPNPNRITTLLSELSPEKALGICATQQATIQALKEDLYRLLICLREEKETLEQQQQYVCDIAREQCEQLAKSLQQNISHLNLPTDGYRDKEEHFHRLFSENFLSELEKVLVLEDIDPQEELHIRLTLLQFMPNDKQDKDLNPRLWSILHDAMVKKHATQFLNSINSCGQSACEHSRYK